MNSPQLLFGMKTGAASCGSGRFLAPLGMTATYGFDLI